MSNSYSIVPIVEGYGEVYAVPVLLRRIAETMDPLPVLLVNQPIRVKAGSFLKDQEYCRRHIELAARKAKMHEKSCILILLDCEDDCPAHLGPQLLANALEFRPDINVLVILAYREYETWFLAAARSLRNVGGLPGDLEPPSNPEALRDAKGWLSARMPGRYNEPNDQPRMTAKFSFEEGSSVPSFSRAFSKIKAFLST